MRHKNVLHTVNNQLENIASAAELLRLRDGDLATQDLCAKIRSAVVNTSAALNPYFSARILEEKSVKQPNQLGNPAIASGPNPHHPTAE
jgi:hypothetical protein